MDILITMPMGIIRNTFIPLEVAKEIESMGNNVIWNTSDVQLSSDELREKITDVDVCITGWGCPQFDEHLLEGAQRLKLIAHTGGSVRALVSVHLYERGIKVISGNKLYAESVAEGVLAYILSSLRDIPFYNNELAEGRWRADNYYQEGLLEQTIGLVGFGMVAKFLVRMLKPFRMKIKVFSLDLDDATCNEYGVERATLEVLCLTSKIISIHVAQTPETYHMFDRKVLEMIPDGTLLVNTARGSIIDESALADELEKGRFRAVLDVFEEEPLPANSRLRGLRNAILIPHMVGPTMDRRRLVTLALLEDMRNLFNGKPLQLEIDKKYAMAMT